ncbi:MAG: GNAT family N-acetyltransferase [Methyloceanibacter sp.]
MTSPIEVRRLNAADAERMRSIVAMLPPPEWRRERVPTLTHFGRALADPAVYVFAAFEGERPAGFASAYRFPSLTQECDLVYIYDVYVAPADQARGIGRRLIDGVIAQCRWDGVTEAWVGTDLDNFPAQRLFVAAGAKGTGQEYVQFEFDLDASDSEER